MATENDVSRIIEGRLVKAPTWTTGLVTALKKLSKYQPILINDYCDSGEKVSRQTRNYRLSALLENGFPFTVKVYTHLHQGSRSLHFMWKIPTQQERLSSDMCHSSLSYDNANMFVCTVMRLKMIK